MTKPDKNRLVVGTTAQSLIDIFDDALKLAEAVQSCLQEDLPDYYLEMHKGWAVHTINIVKRPAEWTEKGIPSPLGGLSPISRSWMFSIIISENRVILTRNGELTPKELALDLGLPKEESQNMTFVLEDPEVFTKIAKQIKEWTPPDGDG